MILRLKFNHDLARRRPTEALEADDRARKSHDPRAQQRSPAAFQRAKRHRGVQFSRRVTGPDVCADAQPALWSAEHVFDVKNASVQ
jgi:hypothetical protein